MSRRIGLPCVLTFHNSDKGTVEHATFLLECEDSGDAERLRAIVTCLETRTPLRVSIKAVQPDFDAATERRQP